MGVEKKKAARRAASIYSTDIVHATLEYMKITNQIEQSTFSVEKINKCQEEMLSLLPLYRHPSSCADQEKGRFFGNLSCNLKLNAWSEPEFLNRLRQAKVDEGIIAQIEKYVRDSEKRRYEFAECICERNSLGKIFNETESLYKNNIGIRASERNKLVVQSLGLSSGNRESKIDKKKLYADYLYYVRKKGLSRRKATEIVRRKHNIQSLDATLKHLFSYRKEILDNFDGDDTVKEFFSKYTKGLILPRR